MRPCLSKENRAQWCMPLISAPDLYEFKTSLVYTTRSSQVGALKICFYLYACVCLESPVCASAREGQKNVSDIPGAGVTGHDKPSTVGAGNQSLSFARGASTPNN